MKLNKDSLKKCIEKTETLGLVAESLTMKHLLAENCSYEDACVFLSAIDLYKGSDLGAVRRGIANYLICFDTEQHV